MLRLGHHPRSLSDFSADWTRFRAVSFVHRFGAALNRHFHYHCSILDGVFEPPATGWVQFRHAVALTPDCVASIAEQVRRRVLRWFARRGLLDPDGARDRLAWEHGGFSLDALVCIAGHDRAGLERLPPTPGMEEVVPGAAPRAPGILAIPGQKPRRERRPSDCARPPFALERIAQVPAANGEQQVVYRLPRPQRDGRTQLTLTPLELIDHLAALIPPPRQHRYRYHGLLAPNSPLRTAAAYRRTTEIGGAPPAANTPASPAAATGACSPVHYRQTS